MEQREARTGTETRTEPKTVIHARMPKAGCARSRYVWEVRMSVEIDIVGI